MVDWTVIRRLGLSFPGWFINDQGEFIAHQKANVYFNISTCDSEMDVKCQVWGVALPGDFYCAHGAHVDKEDEHEAG